MLKIYLIYLLLLFFIHICNLKIKREDMQQYEINYELSRLKEKRFERCCEIHELIPSHKRNEQQRSKKRKQRKQNFTRQDVTCSVSIL